MISKRTDRSPSRGFKPGSRKIKSSSSKKKDEEIRSSDYNESTLGIAMVFETQQNLDSYSK
jgi:hypothetical protein